MNPLFSALMGNNNIMMQAVGAAIRGESPEAFLQNLAKTNPQLRGLDLNNLEQTATSLAKQRGADIDKLTEDVKKTVSGMM